MSEKAQRSPILDEWQQNLAAQLRAIMAIDRISQSDLARAMGMRQTALSRRLLGVVEFSAPELLFIADFMNRNIDDIMAAAKVRATNPCLSHSDQPAIESLTSWAQRGYALATRLYGSAVPLHAA